MSPARNQRSGLDQLAVATHMTHEHPAGHQSHVVITIGYVTCAGKTPHLPWRRLLEAQFAEYSW